MALRPRKVFHSKQRSRRIFWKRITYGGTTVLVIASLVVMVFYGTRLSGVTLGEVVIEGTETVEPERIKERADTVLQGSYLGLIPYRFAYLIPYTKLDAVLSEMPRIADITLTRTGASLIVSVREHVPETLWCGEGVESDCYYVATQGVAYEKAPHLTGNTLLRFVIEGMSPQVGATLLSDHERAQLVAIADTLLARHEFRVAKVEYRADGDAYLTLSGGGLIQISMRNNPEETYANLASVLGSESFHHLMPGNFERIDLRFGNKVFVQEHPVVASTTATTSSEVE